MEAFLLEIYKFQLANMALHPRGQVLLVVAVLPSLCCHYCIITVTTHCVVITHIITSTVVVVVVVVASAAAVLIWAPLSVKDTDGQLIGLWHPVTNFASVRLVQCPQTRGQFWSCVPVAFCGTLLPRSSRRYCRWDGTEPFVCCPQQPTSQPLMHKSKSLIQQHFQHV